jgi:hypothetical protein
VKENNPRYKKINQLKLKISIQFWICFWEFVLKIHYNFILGQIDKLFTLLEL